MRKRELPIDTYVSSDDVETFKMVDDVVFIAYLRPDQEDLLKSFSAVARRYHLSYAFGHTTDAATVDAERVSVPSIICYKNTDGDHRVLKGAFTEADLEAFLESAIPSVVKQFKEKDLEVFMQRDRLTLYIFVHTEDLATTIRHELTSLAKKYEKYVTFAIADLKKYRDMATNFGVRDEGESGPMLVVHAPMNDNVFFHRQGKKIRSDLVEGMLTTILQGKAKHRQVFGEESEELQGRVDVDGQHDEL
jgi:protein disulfide-isomerase A1